MGQALSSGRYRGYACRKGSYLEEDRAYWMCVGVLGRETLDFRREINSIVILIIVFSILIKNQNKTSCDVNYK